MRGAVVAFGLALLGAAPSTWPMYGRAPDHNAAFSGGAAYAWRFDAGAKINGGLAVTGDRLYFDDFARELVALDRRNGRVLWRTHLSNVAMTTPIVDGGLVVVGTGRDNVEIDTGTRLVWGVPGGDEVVAFDANTGHVRWRYATVGEDMPSPALASVHGRAAVVFANGDDHARALDLHTGRLLWSTPVDGVSTMASATSAGGVVYVLAGPTAAMHRPDHVYALRASDGHVLWRAPYGNADGSPTLAGGRVFVEDVQTLRAPSDRNAVNVVYALDARDGHLAWSRSSAAGYLTSIGTNEAAIAGMANGGVFFDSLPAARRFDAFDIATGRVLWSVATTAAVKMSAVAANGRVYAGDTAGMLYVLDEATGRVLSQRRFGAPFTCSSPVIVGSTLYIANDTRLFALPIL